MDDIVQERRPRAVRNRPSQYVYPQENTNFESGDEPPRKRKATRGTAATRRRDPTPLDEHIAKLETKLGKTTAQAKLWKRHNPRGASLMALPPVDLEDLCGDMNLSDRQVLTLCASNDAAPLLATFRKQLADKVFLKQLDSHIGTTTTLGIRKQAKWIAHLACLSDDQRKHQVQNYAVAICAQYARWLYNKNRYGFVARSGLGTEKAMQSCARIVLLVYNNAVAQPNGFFVTLLESQLGYPMQSAARAKWEAKYVFSDFLALHAPSSKEAPCADECLPDQSLIADATDKHNEAFASLPTDYDSMVDYGEEIREDIDADDAAEDTFGTAYRQWRMEAEDLDRARDDVPEASKIPAWTAGIPMGQLRDNSDANIPDPTGKYDPLKLAAPGVTRPIPPEAVVSRMNYQPRSKIVPFDDEEALACAVAFKEQQTKHETAVKYRFRWDEIAAVLARRGTWEVIQHYYSHHREYRMRIKDYGATEDVVASTRDAKMQRLASSQMPVDESDSGEEGPTEKRCRIMKSASVSFAQDDGDSVKDGTQAPRCDSVNSASAMNDSSLRIELPNARPALESLEGQQMQYALSTHLEQTEDFSTARMSADIANIFPFVPEPEEHLRDSKNNNTADHDILLRTEHEDMKLALQTAESQQRQRFQGAQTYCGAHHEQQAQRERDKLTQDHKIELEDAEGMVARLKENLESVRKDVQSQYDLMLDTGLDDARKKHGAAMDELKQQHAGKIIELTGAHTTELDKVNKSLKNTKDQVEDSNALLKTSEQAAEKFYNELQALKQTTPPQDQFKQQKAESSEILRTFSEVRRGAQSDDEWYQACLAHYIEVKIGEAVPEQYAMSHNDYTMCLRHHIKDKTGKMMPWVRPHWSVS